LSETVNLGISSALTFFTGLATGLIVQIVRNRHSSKRAKIERLYPYLAPAYPIIERLAQDSQYVASLQQNGSEDFNDILLKVTTSLDEYSQWFIKLREGGMIPALDSLDKNLLNHFSGLFNYASLTKRHGSPYLSQQPKLFVLIVKYQKVYSRDGFHRHFIRQLFAA